MGKSGFLEAVLKMKGQSRSAMEVYGVLSLIINGT